MHVGVDLDCSLVVVDVLESTIIELQRNRAKIANPGPKDDVDVLKVIIATPF